MAVLCLARPSPRSGRRSPLKDVVDAAAAYLVDYQKQFAFVLADEEYTQQVLATRSSRPARANDDRRILSHVRQRRFTPGSPCATWPRSTASPSRTTKISARCCSSGVPRMEQQLAERNARYNIGTITRNFNEPTFGLLVLERSRDDEFKFDVKRVETDGEASWSRSDSRKRAPGRSCTASTTSRCTRPGKSWSKPAPDESGGRCSS